MHIWYGDHLLATALTDKNKDIAAYDNYSSLNTDSFPEFYQVRMISSRVVEYWTYFQPIPLLYNCIVARDLQRFIPVDIYCRRFIIDLPKSKIVPTDASEIKAIIFTNTWL